MNGELRKFDFIDALRGWAILAVILVHSQIAVPPSTPWLQSVMAGGARGVQLFYIASALTLCMSWHARAGRERSPIRNFYLRRWFRIAPMFYAAIVLYVVMYGFAPRFYAPNGVEWYYIPLTALFLNGFHPETVTSVVPGGWSIVVEMTFYLVLPLLVTRFRTIGSLIALVAIALVVERVMGRVYRGFYLPLYPPDQQYIVHNFVFLNFFGQFPVFAIGMLTYAVFQREALTRRVLLFGSAIFGAWLLWLSLSGRGALNVLMMHVMMGAAFALFALMLSRHRWRVFVNPLTTWAGKLSFSMYLTHFAVIDMLAATGVSRWFGAGNGAALGHYALVATLAASVSWLCYRFIELPGIDAGRRLIDRREETRAAA